MERLIKVIESVRADLPDVFEKNTGKTGRPHGDPARLYRG